MTESKLVFDEQGRFTAAIGPDATRLFAATVLKSAIGLLQKGITPTRGLTMTRALAKVTEYTGQRYKRTGAELALADLQAWIDTARSTIPVEREGGVEQ